MNNKFFLNSIGVAAIIFALAFLIRSVQTANAAPVKPTDIVVEGAADNGKYRVEFSEIELSNNAHYFRAMVYDTQTGKNAVYTWDNAKNAWVDFFAGKDQIPNVIK